VDARGTCEPSVANGEAAAAESERAEPGSRVEEDQEQGPDPESLSLANSEVDQSPSAPGPLPMYCTMSGATLEIPAIDPWSRHRGRLLEALEVCGVVFLDVSADAETGEAKLPTPPYEQWEELLREAQSSPQTFNARQCVDGRFLRFSSREDLRRTVEGDGKSHTPDDRVMFGLTDKALRMKWLQWEDLRWVPDHYRELKTALVDLIRQELAPLCGQEHGPASTFGVKLKKGVEGWGQTALRHCIYPYGGSCTEHTDYGVVTLQHCSSPGLEGHIYGEWQPLHRPDCVVLFAGDMLERLTNGRTKALLHRVLLEPLEPEQAEANAGGAAWSADVRFRRRPTARQSHVFFLQPDWETIVQPLAPFRSGTDADLPPIRYGDWHQEKVSLAFGLPRGVEQRWNDPRSKWAGRGSEGWQATPRMY